MSSTKLPALFQVALPSEGLFLDDLHDPTHPVNSKSLSGKRKGMGVMINDVIYVAMGSGTYDEWKSIGDIKETPIEPVVKDLAILGVRNNIQPTALRDLNVGVDALNITAMTPLAPDFSGSTIISPRPDKLGFTAIYNGYYKVTVSGFLHAQEPEIEGTEATLLLLKNKAPNALLGGSDRVIFHKAREHYISHFSITAYDYISSGEIVNLKIAGNPSNQGKHVIVENAVLTIEKL